MKVESVMVTGANRGIGLEFVRQLSRLSDPPRYIFATYRNAGCLQDLKEIEESSTKSKIILIKMDVTHPEEVEAAKTIVEDTVGEQGLNLLINNAGVAKMEMFPNVTPENLELHYKVNTEGPLLVLQAMLPSLERAAQLHAGTGGMSVSRAAVVNMTSMAGSIANTGFIFTQDLAVPSYKISKAALNMVMRVAAAKVKDKGILIVMMCPGWVKTDMGGREQAVLEPEESIADMLKSFSTLNESHHGTYMDRLATPYPF
ncbi:unnamed protein product [Larinioides sclopetarius]|uniref:C-factor n=1 Tax=Larinioides sclopetarius TaxID=280406 RepID=A0AAV2BYF7_9ARAC